MTYDTEQMGQARRGQAGFTLVEILIAMAIAGMLTVMLMQMIQTWAKAVAHQAAKANRMMCETDLRRLYTIILSRGMQSGGYASIGPWPQQIPVKSPVDWVRPAPGFDEIGFAPSRTPTLLQFRVDGSGTGFTVSALGDTDRDGGLEYFRIGSDVGMFEGPLPWPPSTVTPVNPTGPGFNN